MNNNNGAKKTENGGALVPYVDPEVVKPADYVHAVKDRLKNGKNKAAFALVQEASLQYPEDPTILSYYGYLQALVDKKYRTGVEKCKSALALAKKKTTAGEKIASAPLFLNLGRAYVAAGKKKEALEAFNDGLTYNRKSPDILHELRELGMRKAAPLTFLDRSNPINKYAGLILRPAKKEPAKKK